MCWMQQIRHEIRHSSDSVAEPRGRVDESFWMLTVWRNLGGNQVFRSTAYVLITELLWVLLSFKAALVFFTSLSVIEMWLNEDGDEEVLRPPPLNQFLAHFVFAPLCHQTHCVTVTLWVRTSGSLGTWCLLVSCCHSNPGESCYFGGVISWTVELCSLRFWIQTQDSGCAILF